MIAQLADRHLSAALDIDTQMMAVERVLVRWEVPVRGISTNVHGLSVLAHKYMIALK